MIVYALARLLSLVFQYLPLQVSYRLVTWLADVVYLTWTQKKRNMWDNMAHVLGPGASWKQVNRLAKQSLHNYFKYLVDFLRFPVLTQEEIQRLVKITGWENFDKALEAGRGIIFISLHMGNWDFAAAAMALRNYKMNVVVDSLKPPKLDAFVVGARTRMGMKVIPLEKAARQVFQALRQNEALALLIDRPLTESGVIVRFFNGFTRVPSVAARLALRTGARVIPAGLIRLPDNSFQAIVGQHIHFQPTGDLKGDIQAFTQRIMNFLEEIVRQHPDQWYMFRRMWLPTPPAEGADEEEPVMEAPLPTLSPDTGP